MAPTPSHRFVRVKKASVIRAVMLSGLFSNYAIVALNPCPLLLITEVFKILQAEYQEIGQQFNNVKCWIIDSTWKMVNIIPAIGLENCSVESNDHFT